MAKLKKRQKEILKVILELRQATAREIAEKTNLHVNGLMQTLGVLTDEKFLLEGKQYQLHGRYKSEVKGGNPDRILWYLVEK
ncbi:MAG: hypothetical protein NTX82_07305 [Candidatus Parcubacteria bacterium]|nr:hypothetical protein [Candidatus Parcubacteria bacterium]